MAPRRTQPLCSSPAFSWKFIPSSAADTSVEGRARLKGGENTKAKGKQTVLPLRWSQPRCRASKGRQMATAPSPAQLTSFHQGYYIIPKLPARDHTKQKKEKREGTESFGRGLKPAPSHTAAQSLCRAGFSICAHGPKALTQPKHKQQSSTSPSSHPLPQGNLCPGLLTSQLSCKSAHSSSALLFAAEGNDDGWTAAHAANRFWSEQQQPNGNIPSSCTL